MGVDRYAIYVQDYGAPVGRRLALNHHPERITAIITQNGNGYEDGFDDAFWGPVWDFNADPTPEKAAAIGDVLGLGVIQWQLFTEAIDWRVPEDEKLPWTGMRTRKSEVPEYFRTLWTGMEAGQSIVDFDTILVDGDDAVRLARFSHLAAPTGRRFGTDVSMRLTVKDGEIVRIHLYEDTLAVARAYQG
jgi:hypothetical protein